MEFYLACFMDSYYLTDQPTNKPTNRGEALHSWVEMETLCETSCGNSVNALGAESETFVLPIMTKGHVETQPHSNRFVSAKKPEIPVA